MSDIPNSEEIEHARAKLASLCQVLGEVIYGQEKIITHAVIALVSRGHVLFEGMPGLGKTELVKALSSALGIAHSRIQFTPDLLPGDITGNPVLQESGGERRFVFQQGPLFANIVLADEINRASPKTQSALLEAMQEKCVTVMGERHELPDPFFVFATQNPVELEGTYPLPEAQLDRFLFKLEVPVNSGETLKKIIRNREMGVSPKVDNVLSHAELEQIISLAKRVYLPDIVIDYISRLVDSTHPAPDTPSEKVRFGASPRAALALSAAVRARALIEGRPHASVEDVKNLAGAVMGHRILLDYSAKLEGITSGTVVENLCAAIPSTEKEVPGSIQA